MARAPVSKTGCCRFESYLACIFYFLPQDAGVVMKKIKIFLMESYGELKKVVWPSRDSVTASTKVVLVSTVIFAMFFGFVDFVMVNGLYLLF